MNKLNLDDYLAKNKAQLNTGGQKITVSVSTIDEDSIYVKDLTVGELKQIIIDTITSITPNNLNCIGKCYEPKSSAKTWCSEDGMKIF